MNRLQITNFTSFGAYLDAKTGKRKDNILLPKKEVPQDAVIGDTLNVFIYRDSQNRLIATMRTPIAMVGELAYLKVTAITKIGAFLDIGLERGLFLPFREQKYPVIVGKHYLVYIYLDKTERLCCTTDIYPYLRSDSPYHKNDKVTGTIYDIQPQIGVFVAVDNQYKGLIPKNEAFGKFNFGEQISARVIRVRDDGKLDLSPREVAHVQKKLDAQILLEAMKNNNGWLPIDEKASPEEIEKHFKMSKGAFKRAIGNLLKEKRIEITNDGIKLL